MQNNRSKSSRYAWVDVAKGIAIILVVYRHVLIGIRQSGVTIQPYLMEINEMVYSFRMPLFFILSGFFFAKSVAKRSEKELFRYKASTLIYPYLIWAIVQVSLQVLLHEYANANRTLKDYVYILIHPRAIDQLWFLYSLFNVTILYYALKYKMKLPRYALLIICLVGFYCSTFVKYYGLIHDLLFYLIFFFIGDVCAKKMLSPEFQEKFGSTKFILIMLPFFGVTQWYWLGHPDMHIFAFSIVVLLGSFFTLAISMRIANYPFFSFLKLVGKNSLQVYVMHVLVSSAFRIVITEFLGYHNTYLLLFMGFSTGILIPLYVVKLSEKYKWINWAFNPPKKRTTG